MSQRRSALLVAAITALGAALRLYDLGGRSLWVDELATWEGTQQPTFASLLAWMPGDQMPLSFVLGWLLRGLDGSEAGIRAASAACGILLVPAAYLLARRVAGTAAGLWAALLAAVSPFLVWYSQEATAYALLLLTSTLAAWAAHRAEERARLGDWLLLAVAAAAAGYAHYTGLLVITGLYGWTFAVAWARRDGLRAMGAATSSAVAAALLAPWSPWIRGYLTYAPPLADKLAAPGLAPPEQVARLVTGLGLVPVALPLAVAGVVALRTGRRTLALLAAWLALPVLAIAATGGLDALALPARYFTAAVPPLLVLAGAGAAWLAKRLPALARLPATGWLAAVAIALTLPQLLAWYGEPKDDWRAAAAFIRQRAAPGYGVVVLGYGTLWSRRDVGYYLQRDGEEPEIVDISAPVDPAAVPVLTAAHPVFVVIATGDGPADLRLDGRSQTGPFTPVPAVDRASGMAVHRGAGVTVVEAPRIEDVLAWAAPADPQAAAWAAAVGQR